MAEKRVCSEGHVWEFTHPHPQNSTCPVCGRTSTADAGGAGTMQVDELPPLPSPLVLPQGDGVASLDETDTSFLPSVDGYVLLSELGRGGVGVVYRARQTDLDRTVALKMLLSGELSDERQRARFRREAQAVAQLQHPNIVQLHSAGEQNGRPFLSMELVDGPSLSQAIAGRPWPAFAAATLVEKLARAIECAHAKGIVHRDLKPANVLLQRAEVLQAKRRDDPVVWDSVEPKITDFGLAKRDDDVLATRSGTVLGTPSYMAPEQASGNVAAIGPRTDVYALGAILYEILTGRPPFLAATSTKTIQQVLVDDPIPPRKLQPTVPHDLETICLRCLAREPDRRYHTAFDLADDLRRYRQGCPILARPVSPLERCLKWLRRRPAIAGLLCVSAIATSALLGTWGVLTAQLKIQRDEARQARQDESAQRTIAEDNFQRARAAVDDFFVTISQEQLLEKPGLQPVRRKLLESALHFYLGFLKERSDDPSLKIDVARTYGRVGLIRHELGEIDDALTSFEEARKIYAAAWEHEPSQLSTGQLLASTYHDIALMQRLQGRFTAALASYGRALAINERLVAATPSASEPQRDLAKTLSNMGVLASAMGRTDEAIDSGRRACGILERIARDSNAPTDRQNFARGLINLSEAQDPKDAITSLSSAARLLGTLINEDPLSQEYRIQSAKCLYNLGTMQGLAGQLDACRGSIEQAITQFRELVSENPSVPDLRYQLAICLHYFSEFQCQHDQLSAASRLASAGRHEIETLLVDSPDRADFRSLYGAVLQRQAEILVQEGRPSEAIAPLEAAIEQQQLALAATPDSVQYRSFLLEHRKALARLVGPDGLSAEPTNK